MLTVSSADSDAGQSNQPFVSVGMGCGTDSLQSRVAVSSDAAQARAICLGSHFCLYIHMNMGVHPKLCTGVRSSFVTDKNWAQPKSFNGRMDEQSGIQRPRYSALKEDYRYAHTDYGHKGCCAV